MTRPTDERGYADPFTADSVDTIPLHAANDCPAPTPAISSPRSWRVSALVALMKAGSRLSTARISGLRLTVPEGHCNPAPTPLFSFRRLFEAGVNDLEPQMNALDMGTGCGVWALMAVRRGACVTATDLPHIDMDTVAANAQDNGIECPELLHGDLFAPVAGRTFDRVLFNPPFHYGNPRTAAETAYLGGSSGELITRFLNALPSYLEPTGSACLLLPNTERKLYASKLAQFDVNVRAEQWMPLLGRCFCLELKVK